MIKSELNFGLDNFGKQTTLSAGDTIARLILNILFMRPGQLPSMPHVGINVRKYLYSFDGDIDIEEIKRQLAYQCSTILPCIDVNNIRIFTTEYRNDTVLMMIIPSFVGAEEKELLVGLRRSEDQNILFNYQFEDKLV